MRGWISALLLIACAPGGAAESAHDALVESMTAYRQAGMERLKQDPMQAACSRPRYADLTAAELEAVLDAARAGVELPADRTYLGDWARGAEVASSGRGLQFSDDPAEVNGGNCYACHQLDPREVAYGTIGPSLTGYGARGRSQAMLEYTWSKLWDPHATLPCSHMPRFGAQGILTMQQLRDVMAYLLDPDSPVNRPAADGRATQ